MGKLQINSKPSRISLFDHFRSSNDRPTSESGTVREIGWIYRRHHKNFWKLLIFQPPGHQTLGSRYMRRVMIVTLKHCCSSERHQVSTRRWMWNTVYCSLVSCQTLFVFEEFLTDRTVTSFVLSIRALKDHVLDVHAKPKKCPCCDKTFSKQSNMKRNNLIRRETCKVLTRLRHHVTCVRRFSGIHEVSKGIWRRIPWAKFWIWWIPKSVPITLIHEGSCEKCTWRRK
jgi:hypothetical protein